jgi:acetyltransferase-like isoleucine patch superfamily enzyme
MIYAPWQYREYGEGVQVFEHCTILKPENISLHNFCRVDARCRLEGGLGLTIGEHTHIASGSCLNTGGGELWFGAHSGCSVNVVIATGNPDLSYLNISAAEAPEDCHVIRKKTVIGEYVVIFAGAVLVPGIEIGDKAVVAAGAVVTKSVPARAIVAGTPARIIGYRSITKEPPTP